MGEFPTPSSQYKRRSLVYKPLQKLSFQPVTRNYGFHLRYLELSQTNQTPVTRAYRLLCTPANAVLQKLAECSTVQLYSLSLSKLSSILTLFVAPLLFPIYYPMVLTPNNSPSNSPSTAAVHPQKVFAFLAQISGFSAAPT
jgi:hypothetical protein